MKQKFIFLLICCYSFSASAQKEKSKELTSEAVEIYLYSELESQRKIDSSLALVNQALDLDSNNIQALTHKTTLLFRKKDIGGLIKTSNKLIELNPDKPFYLGQKAIFLEIKGDLALAKSYYAKALKQYQELLKSNEENFDLMLEYVSVLEASGKTNLANSILKSMEEMDFADYQKEMINLYRKQSVSKNQLIRYWNGEIDYNQVKPE